MTSSKVQIILDIICIVLVLAMAFYIFTHQDYYKAFTSDPCRLCEAKTNATCVREFAPTIRYIERPDAINLSKLNFTNT